MMLLSWPVLFYRCAILLVSFEGTICPLMDFVIESFSIADIYYTVEVTGSEETGQFVFKKSNPADSARQLPYVLPFSDILPDSLVQEENNLKVVTFFVRGQDQKFVSYNIKFEADWQAERFATDKILPASYVIRWARIYSKIQPVIVSYDTVDNDGMAFKLLDNGNYPDYDARLLYLPYLFKRSEIKDEFKMTYPRTLFLRNKVRAQDYRIRFKSEADIDTFLNLFPNRRFDEFETVGYYYMTRFP